MTALRLRSYYGWISHYWEASLKCHLQGRKVDDCMFNVQPCSYCTCSPETCRVRICIWTYSFSCIRDFPMFVLARLSLFKCPHYFISYLHIQHKLQGLDAQSLSSLQVHCCFAGSLSLTGFSCIEVGSFRATTGDRGSLHPPKQPSPVKCRVPLCSQFQCWQLPATSNNHVTGNTCENTHEQWSAGDV